MEEVIDGIKEGELETLILEIRGHRERISKIFEKVDACMRRLRTNYQGPACDWATKYYKEMKPCFAVTEHNINTYAEDLSALIGKTNENAIHLDNMLRNAMEITKQELKNKIPTIGQQKGE